MRDLRERYGVAALALEFAILTATRTSETLNAAWSEFDLDNKLWTIPPERMKGGREHRVPLCDRAIAIVAEMRTVKCSDFVFPGAKRGKPLSNMAMLTTLRRMESRRSHRARLPRDVQDMGRRRAPTTSAR